MLKTQNRAQRGFTTGSSPMNSALIVEECYRDAKDKNIDFQLILLDAKAAFDTVVHSHMLRRVFLAGIDNRHWTLIKSLHENAKSSVKWDGNISEPFNVNQGVRQGGILSTDLYKLYINPLLDRLETSGLGLKIGNISVSNTACADDIALISEIPDEAQTLVNMATDFAFMEGYQLQTTESVAMNVSSKKNQIYNSKSPLQIGSNNMPFVDNAVHLGIIRTTSLRGNTTTNVDENIKKARRSAYGLFSSGFHGYNGLDVDTMLHLYKIYILPVLLYGLELILPQGPQLEQLEIAQKRLLKQILALPNSVADIAVYILTGILPIEAQIHIRALGLFNNVCRQAEDSSEKALARRQLLVKPDSSTSWFVGIKHLHRKYELKEAISYLDEPESKTKWTRTVKEAVYKKWVDKITSLIPLYKGLTFLTFENLEKGKIHPLFKVNCHTGKDISRLSVKLKLLTGSYILQSKRIRMYKTETEATCLLCKEKEETMEHFILGCRCLETIRNTLLHELVTKLKECDIDFWQLNESNKIQLILDSTTIGKTRKITSASAQLVEILTRRLIFQLHITR